MDNDLIAARYAKAMFLHCNEDLRLLQRIARELNILMNYYRHGLSELFENPIFSTTERQHVLNKIFQKHNILQSTQNFIESINSRHRFYLFPEIYKEYRKMIDMKLGRTIAEVITVSPMPPEMANEYRQIIHKIVGESALIKQRVDPDILGGALIKIDNLLIDGSIRGQLVKFANTLKLPKSA